jgi:hypothetical protein
MDADYLAVDGSITNAFAGMPKLKQLFLANQVTGVASDAFKNCPSLEKFVLGSPSAGNKHTVH